MGRAPRWAGVAPAVGVALAVGAREVPSASPGGERILPGREAVVLRMVRDAAPPEPISSIKIDRALVRLHRAGGDPVVVVRRRGTADLPDDEAALGGGISLQCPGGRGARGGSPTAA